MFTGLILTTGQLVELNDANIPIIRVRIDFPQNPVPFPSIKIGDSIAVNGACLTVVAINHDLYEFNLSRETLKLANYKDLIRGSHLNIERPLSLNSLIDGHMVSGHLDGTVRVRSISKRPESTRLSFTFTDKSWRKFIIHKGSVTLNGVSLTISERGESFFSVDIIPHTLKSTNLLFLKKGERVNVEFDMFAKYIYNMMKYK